MGQGGKQTKFEGEKKLNQPLRNVNIYIMCVLGRPGVDWFSLSVKNCNKSCIASHLGIK